MKTASYRYAIEWIALNDGAGDPERLDEKHVGSLVSSVLVEDLFGAAPGRVGRDVVRKRRQLDVEGRMQP